MRDRVKLIVNNREIRKRYLGNRLVWEAIKKLYTFRKNMTLNIIYHPKKQGQGFIMQSDPELDRYVERTRKLVFRAYKAEPVEFEVESVLKSFNTVYFYLSQNEYNKARSSLGTYIDTSRYDIDIYGI